MINMYTKFEVSGLSRSRDILGGTKHLKLVTWRDHAPFRDNLSSIGYDQHVHQIWSLQHEPFQRYIKWTKSLKWVTWRGNAHFRDVLSSIGWDLLCSTHILSLKCLRLPAAKKWRAAPNVKIFVLSHPLGDLGITYTVHLWLSGKRVVDFLLAIIEFFASSHCCGTNEWNVSKSAFSDGWVTLRANFR